MYKIVTFILLIFTVNLYSQETEQKKPKIGLVLSGGGAKGLAHIGVLKVLEESNVKIDYITGTSMGAIVGGLYATGYSAVQIDSIFAVTDFDVILRDRIPRSSKNFYEKRNDELYTLILPFEKFKVGVPTAYSKGLNIYNLLARLTHNSRHIHDFSKLPIPFLCVATDIETGKQVILDKGILPNALLASAAFPSLFSPVIIDDKVLIDGGVANNYPIEEIRNLGADIVIGVDVQDDLKDRNNLQNATKILVQISNLQMIEKMQLKREKTDIYIKPDIRGYNVISFNDGDNIIKKGEEAGRNVIEKLKALAKDDGSYKVQRVPNKVDSLCVSKISINKLENYTRAYIIGKLGFNADTDISYEDLKNGIDNLNATQNFSSISYSFESDNGNDALVLELKENPIKTYLKLGIHYDDLYKTGVLLNVTQKKMIFKNDVASFDVVLGDNFRYYFDYYIDNGFYWSVGFNSRFNSFNRNIKLSGGDFKLLEGIENKSVNIDYSDFSNKIYLQTIIKHKFLAGGELEYKNIRVTSSTTNFESTIFQSSKFLTFNLYLKYDSFDDYYFPSRGYYLNSNYQTYVYSSKIENDFNKFSYFKTETGFATSFSDKTTLLLQAEGGFSIGKNTMPFYDFMLGGFGFNQINNFNSFYGYDFLSLNGNSYLKAVITYDYEFLRKNHFNIAANFAQIGNNIFDSDKWISKPRYTGYAIGYGLETVFGPVQIKHSWSPETSDHHTWFSVGFWF